MHSPPFAKQLFLSTYTTVTVHNSYRLSIPGNESKIEKSGTTCVISQYLISLLSPSRPMRHRLGLRRVRLEWNISQRRHRTGPSLHHVGNTVLGRVRRRPGGRGPSRVAAAAAAATPFSARRAAPATACGRSRRLLVTGPVYAVGVDALERVILLAITVVYDIHIALAVTKQK